MVAALTAAAAAVSVVNSPVAAAVSCPDVEVVFARGPADRTGLGWAGKAFVDSALNRDYAVMMGVTILVGALTILFNLVVDILYAWIDPKIRY